MKLTFQYRGQIKQDKLMSECSVSDSDEHCGEKLTKEGGTGNSEQATRDDFTEKVILIKTYRKERSFYFSSVT